MIELEYSNVSPPVNKLGLLPRKKKYTFHLRRTLRKEEYLKI